MKEYGGDFKYNKIVYDFKCNKIVKKYTYGQTLTYLFKIHVRPLQIWD